MRSARSASCAKCPMILLLPPCSRTVRKSQWNPLRLNRVSSTSLIFDEISSAGCSCAPTSAHCLQALNCNLNFPLRFNGWRVFTRNGWQFKAICKEKFTLRKYYSSSSLALVWGPIAKPVCMRKGAFLTWKNMLKVARVLLFFFKQWTCHWLNVWVFN